jgi:hypothetical protein
MGQKAQTLLMLLLLLVVVITNLKLRAQKDKIWIK